MHLASESFLSERFTKIIIIIGSVFLEANTLIQSNFELRRLDRGADSCYVVGLTQYGLLRPLREIKAILSKINAHLLLRVFLLLFLQVQFLLPSRVQRYFQHNRRYVLTLRWATWFTENSTTSDEYGLTFLANNRKLRHIFGTGFCCTLSQLIKNQTK